MTRTRVRWPVIALVAAALSVGFLAGRASGDPGATRGSGAVARDVYVVEPGDTLWEIARTRVPAEADPRAYVEELGAANGLDGAALVPGMRLILPVA